MRVFDEEAGPLCDADTAEMLVLFATHGATLKEVRRFMAPHPSTQEVN